MKRTTKSGKSTTSDDAKALWRAIEILKELGELELAYKLRVEHDTQYLTSWGRLRLW